LDVEVVMDEKESAIAALRSTGLHRCTTMTRPACTSEVCNQGREPCPTPAACQLPDEPESYLSDPAKAIVYAATIAVALLGVAAALFS